ncbi:phage tail protein [Erwinia rhapontici]|uniref:phage tail protein n=1 Tax=Erwinia rhapontici TaxID=55212 RepID=UPI003BA176F6
MTTKYYAILTTLGAGKLANAAALGTKLQITHMALGDGGGVLPSPNASQTALIGEKRRAPLNSLSVDAANSSQIIAEQVIPEDEGGWWIREIGLFDADGVLIAVANCAETYKPLLQEGSGRTQTVRMILIVNSTDAVTLKIDPSVVLATRKYVDDSAAAIKVYVDAQKASPAFTGKPTAPTAAKTDNSTQLATTAFVKSVTADYATTVSPALSGTPTAPTPAAGNNSQQVANTAFVRTALAELVGGSPEALDTLKELADALGGDANFSTTVLNALAKKMDISAGVTAKMKYGCPLIGSLIYWPLELMPHEIFTDMDMEFIPCINQTFDGVKYPLLAKLHPALRLPADMRAEYVRGWDNGRGVNSGRGLLTAEAGAIEAHVHTFTRIWGAASPDPTGGPYLVGADSGGGLTAHTSVQSDSTGGNENRVRNVAWNMIVRAK